VLGRTDHTKALAAIGEVAGSRLDAEQQRAAAELLVDLWAVAARHGITPKQWGWRRHLPRAAVDTIAAIGRRGPRSGRHQEPAQREGSRR
jgi:hypothetical protein